jgi:hypothetical protein
MVLVIISIRILAILASYMSGRDTIICSSTVDLANKHNVVPNRLNGLIEHNSLTCSDKIVPKQAFIQIVIHFLFRKP